MWSLISLLSRVLAPEVLLYGLNRPVKMEEYLGGEIPVTGGTFHGIHKALILTLEILDLGDKEMAPSETAIGITYLFLIQGIMRT